MKHRGRGGVLGLICLFWVILTAWSGLPTMAQETPAPALPEIYLLDVTSAPAGSFIVVAGRDFGTAGTLRFGSTQASDVVSWNSARIVARVPAGAGSPVTVQTSAGTSNGRAFSTHSGRTLWVSKSGSDSNSGTEAAPFLTIDRARTASAPGDVILIHGGTYLEASGGAGLYLRSGNSGTASAPITYRGYPGESVIIDGRNGGGSTVYVAASHIQFTGLRITGASGTGWVATNQVSSVRIADSDLYENNVVNPGSSGAGINIQHGTTAVKVLGNRIRDNGSSVLDHGLYIKGNQMEIAYNEVYGNFGYGIHVYNDSGGQFQDAWVHSNRSWSNGRSGILVSRGSVGTTVENNVSYENEASGIALLYNPQNTVVRNNTTYNNGGSSYYEIWIAESANTTLRNNIVSSSAARMLRVDSSASGVDVNFTLYDQGGSGTFRWRDASYDFAGYRQQTGQDANSKVDVAGFVAAVNHDYHLSANSPALDCGDAANSPAVDMEGYARPWGGGVDLGAYEYSEAGSGPPDPDYPSPVTNVRRTDRTDSF